MYSLITDKGLEAFGRYYSSYRAVVIDDIDPKGMNRLIVNIPSISRAAIWASPKGQDGSIKSGFKWLTPKKGQIVWVEFQSGDFRYPIWTYHGWGADEIPDKLNGSNKAGFVTRSGHYLTIDDDNGILSIGIVNPNDDDSILTSLIIDNSSIKISTEKSGEPITSINLSEGNVSVNTTEEITLKGKKIKLMSGDEGIPKSSSVLSKLMAIENDINMLRAAMNIGATGVTSLVPTFSSVQTWAATTPLTVTKIDDLTNKDILQ